jgi:hypothetical protein
MLVGISIILNACDQPISKRLELVGFGLFWCGQNPDLGVPTPSPPIERQDAS